MKKILCFLMVFTFAVEGFSAPRKKAGSSKRVATAGKIRTASLTTTTTTNSTEEDSFESCMDNICKSELYEDKGRCRCSSQLGRIEKVLRDIEKIQNQADEDNKLMETLMNVSNTANVDDTVGSVYDNINSIEKKAKTISARAVDKDLLVMEGLPLYEAGLKKCKGFLDTLSSKDKDKKKEEYTKLIEGDCSAYTTILKEKADSAQNLLVQAQKNREKFDEQEYKKRNQLDTNACYVEYEACAKTECGTDFKYCKDSAKQATVLKKCQAVNYGKCEDNKTTVIADVKKYIAKELEKVRLVDNCKAAMGHLQNGKCLFKVMYIADKCSSGSGCGSSQVVWATPRQKFKCDDTRGSFKELIAGCYESCYIIGPNDEKIYKGTNHSDNMGGQIVGAIFSLGISVAHTLPGCVEKKNIDTFYTPAAPDGWGEDGYPTNPEYKGIL